CQHRVEPERYMRHKPRLAHAHPSTRGGFAPARSAQFHTKPPVRGAGSQASRARSGWAFRASASRLYSGPQDHHGEDSVSTRFINPATMSKPPGYTHVVEATTPGRIVYVAGQLGLDAAGNVAGAPGDFRAQAKQTFENLKNALAAVGATLNDVVKLNNYLT